MPLIFIVNTPGLFLWKKKKVWLLLLHFKKYLDQSKISVAKSKEHKPNKICVDKGSEFGTKSIKTCSQDHNIQIYSTHNELKSVAAEKIVWNLKIKSTNIRLQYRKMCILIN